ncbi:hypothetical protein V6N11_077374 [Hibiscus sabdariffa]|uniref:Uncharacterized protein n=1 Tax=Hibiscus sabdariffa TaxID=183260 RepID=A0ABR2TDP2_9ROSI
MVLLRATADRAFVRGESSRTYGPWMVVTRCWESGDVEVDPKEVEVMPVTEQGKVDHVGHGRRSHKEGNSSSEVVNGVVGEMSAAIPATPLAVVGGGSDVVEINGNNLHSTVPVILLSGLQEMNTKVVQVSPKVTHSAKGSYATIVIQDNENMVTDMNAMGKGSVGPIRTTKTISKRGISLRKHGPNMGSSKSVLREWNHVFVANIDKVAQEVQQHKDDVLPSLENESESNYSNQSTILGGVVDVVAPVESVIQPRQ